MAGEFTPQVTIEQHRGVDVIRLLGENDMATEHALTHTIGAAVAEGRGVVISLVDTEFIDSTVINAIYPGDRLQRTRGRRLAIHVSTSSIVRRTLEISEVCATIPCAADLQDAIGHASDGAGAP